MTVLNKEGLRTLLGGAFEPKHVDAALEHFELMTLEFQKQAWEESLIKAGKLVEAVLKALALRAGLTVPSDKEFKVDGVIRDLGNAPAASAATTVRVTIPRACRFVYEIASNRGARHDPGEISPNEMDATVAVSNCSWMVAELFRYAMKGAVNPAEAQSIVTRMTQRRVPMLEEIDGRLHIHLPKLGPKEIALLNLWHSFPDRVCRNKLIEAAVRRGATPNAARLGLNRLNVLIDDDGNGNLLLLAPGIVAAEELLKPGSGEVEKNINKRKRRVRARRSSASR